MEINVPDLGVESAEVSEIMVKVGDIIKVDDNIVLLESDKASVEVPTPIEGKITSVNLKVGDKVKEGDLIMTIEAVYADQTDTAVQATTSPASTETTQQLSQEKLVQDSQSASTNPTTPSAVAQPAQASSNENAYTLPDLGVEQAQVSEWLINVGDSIEKDQPLVLVESDKASVEVPAPVAGKIVSQLVNAGDTVKNGQEFVVIASSEASESRGNVTANTTSSTNPSAPSTPAAAQSTMPTTESTNANSVTREQTYALPDLGVETAQVSEVMVKEGDTIEADQPVVLVESDKASVEVPAPTAGKVVKILVKAGDSVKNGQDFMIIAGTAQSDVPTAAPVATQPTTAPVEKTQAQTQHQPVSTTSVSQTQSGHHDSVAPNQLAERQLTESQINAKHADVYAGPAVRKLTRQLGVDISEVKGSGSHGRIVKEDIFAYVKNRMQTMATPTQAATPANAVRSGLPNLPDMSKTDIWGETETQDLSRLQKVSIPQLTYNTYLPQVTQFDLSDITDTEKMRSDIKEEMKKEGVSLTILAFIMKATAYALMQFPKFNSHLSDDNSQIIIRKTVNMGFAVATDDGLTVPVIQNVQNKGIKQLAIEIGELAKTARDKKLGAKELQGASFTISSQGNLGGTYFTPLVNWPQVAILGVSESSMQPRWNEEKQTFEPRLMLPLSLSYDHRVINGADAAVFTRYIAKLLADPRRILL